MHRPATIKRRKRKMKEHIRSIMTILKLIHQQRPYTLSLGLSSSFFKSLVAYIPLWFTSWIINVFTVHGVSQQLWELVFVLAVSILCCEGLQYILEFRLHIAVKELELQLEKNISEKVMYLAYDRLEDKDSLDMIERAKDGLSQSGGVIAMMSQFSSLLETLFTIIMSLALLLYLLQCHSSNISGIFAFFDSIWAGAIILLMLLGYICFGNYLSRSFEKAGQTFFVQNTKLSRENDYYCNEVALNSAMAKDIRIFQMQEAVLEEMEQRQKKSLKYFTIFIKRIAGLFTESVFFGNMINTIFYMLIIIKVYFQSIPIGDFVTYAGSMAKLNNAISTFPIIYTDLHMKVIYMMYYDEFLKLPDQRMQDEKAIQLNEESIITFDHVSYRYPHSESDVLKDISFTLQPRKKTAIVGQNGAGKTTLIKLLCGLYKPTSGQILIDGTPVNSSQLSALQNNFGVVFQDFTLFDGMLKDIITNQTAENEEQILAVLKQSGFEKNLQKLSVGIYTNIGIQENGVQLSGGEAQKVAIARALYADRPWVILDEPTAALDPLSEIEIYTHLNDLIKDKSAIYISHRMSSCQFCDDIIVLDKGKIIQRGTHEMLYKEQGLYQKLWNAQADYFK